MVETYAPAVPTPGNHARLSGTGYRDLKADNSRLLREDVARGAVVFRGLPEVVTLNHSDLCNLRCIMCPRNLGQGTHRLDRRVLELVGTELFPTARKLVLTTAGGDPLVADFDFLLELALRYDVRVDAVTNGVLLTGEVYRRARGALDHLNVSLDSSDPATFERIRLGARWERVLRNLHAVREERRRQRDDVLFSLSALVMKSTLPQLADFVRFAHDLEVDGVVFQRLRHEVKPTPQEEPASAFTPAEVAAAIDAASATAAELGVNLFLADLGRANVLPRPVRAKVPETLEGKGMCWWIAQNFNVMFTGEVFPCCVPTDYCLGDVMRDDPVAIWNGLPFQRLRAAHVSRRGTTFCSGCDYAPHLHRPNHERLVRTTRWARIRLGYGVRAVQRAWRRLFDRAVFDPAVPDLVHVPVEFPLALQRTKVLGDAPRCDLAVVAPDGGSWSLHAGGLWHAARPTAEPALLTQVTAPDRVGTLLYPLADGAALVAFEGEGRVLRVAPGRTEVVLALSDARSFVRQPNVATTADGRIWVGEYGVFPGARCARLYRSDDGARGFVEVAHFDARHVHVVRAVAGGTRVLVTTGDLARERRMYLAGTSGRPRCLRRAWSGFTAVVEIAGTVICGTDLLTGNGLLTFNDGLRSVPDFRAFPADLDLQVRDLHASRSGRLLALCGLDGHLRQRDGRRSAILSSDDRGRSWSVVHRFAADWDDAPEWWVVRGESPFSVTTTGARRCLRLAIY